jgi:hypothetical protein
MVPSVGRYIHHHTHLGKMEIPPRTCSPIVHKKCQRMYDYERVTWMFTSPLERH